MTADVEKGGFLDLELEVASLKAQLAGSSSAMPLRGETTAGAACGFGLGAALHLNATLPCAGEEQLPRPTQPPAEATAAHIAERRGLPPLESTTQFGRFGFG